MKKIKKKKKSIHFLIERKNTNFPRLDDLSFKYDEKFPMKNSSRFFFSFYIYKKMKYKIGIKKKNKNQQQQHAVLNNKGLND